MGLLLREECAVYLGCEVKALILPGALPWNL